jgi:hypothetical protein
MCITLISLSAQVKVYRVWDYEKGESAIMTEAMFHEAWTEPASHMGCIEAGIDLVLCVLTNCVRTTTPPREITQLLLQNKNQKCLLCELGARGQSTSTKGHKLHGDGQGYLNKCRCPLDTTLTKFWMYKITSANT